MTESLLPLDDPYAELGLAPTVPDPEIRRAYFALVRTCGPEQDPGRFKRIRAAYEQLASPEKRFEADQLRLQPWLAPEGRQAMADWPGQVLAAARSLSDLERRHFREDYREVAP